MADDRRFIQIPKVLDQMKTIEDVYDRMGCQTGYPYIRQEAASRHQNESASYCCAIPTRSPYLATAAVQSNGLFSNRRCSSHIFLFFQSQSLIPIMRESGMIRCCSERFNTRSTVLALILFKIYSNSTTLNPCNSLSNLSSKLDILRECDRHRSRNLFVKML